ncbi:MAG: DNA primase [Patescibacteria group bacterium]
MLSSVEKIKSRLNIVEVVGSYLKLEKAGANFRARCPFHNEKSPSFFVSPARDTFHCFGCSKGGDIISFVEEIEGLDFIGALKVLAERAGVELEPFKVSDFGAKEKLYEVMAEAVRFYTLKLAEHSEAQNYLLKRGVKAETIKEFQIGFAPTEWQALGDYLSKKGYTLEQAEQAGLVVKSTKEESRSKYYDRFRSRIMFPINDSSGRAVGFSGRIFGEQKTDTAKYVNSPETLLYNKSRLLFGYDKARMAIRRADFVVLVEGQFDLVMSHQAGLKQTVAVSGTAFSREHLNLIKRLTNNIVMAFDPDSAGLNAGRRVVMMALAEGFEVKIAELPAGVDPADLAARNANEWLIRVKESRQIIDFYLATFTKSEPDRRKRAHLFRKELYPLLAILNNRIDESIFVSKVADNLGLPEAVVMADVTELKTRNPVTSFSQKETGETVISEIKAPNKTRKERLEEKIIGLIFWAESLGSSVLPLSEVKQRFKVVDFSAEKDRLILEAELNYSDSARLETEFKELLKQVEIEGLKEELAEVFRQLKTAESSGDTSQVDSWLKKCQDISREINNLR